MVTMFFEFVLGVALGLITQRSQVRERIARG